ncbi:hypothetical protein YC2023_106364 [Brassica napus]
MQLRWPAEPLSIGRHPSCFATLPPILSLGSPTVVSLLSPLDFLRIAAGSGGSNQSPKVFLASPEVWRVSGWFNPKISPDLKRVAAVSHLALWCLYLPSSLRFGTGVESLNLRLLQTVMLQRLPVRFGSFGVGSPMPRLFCLWSYFGVWSGYHRNVAGPGPSQPRFAYSPFGSGTKFKRWSTGNRIGARELV